MATPVYFKNSVAQGNQTKTITYDQTALQTLINCTGGACNPASWTLLGSDESLNPAICYIVHTDIFVPSVLLTESGDRLVLENGSDALLLD